ncbi:MAG: hypothetical protein WBD07_02530 [Vicinamibacterales bacterium]
MVAELRLPFTLLFAAVLAGAPTTAAPGQRADAEALWNQAVAAKGGRARLEAVRNLVVTERTVYSRNTRVDPGFMRQRLYVLPARLWEFVDHRPGILGFGLQIVDLDQRVGWSAAGPLPAREGIFDGVRNDLLHGQLLYLIETAFLKPEPVRSRSGRVGRAAVDIVETRLPSSDVRAEYYLDRQSHLPIRVVLFYTVRTPPDAPVAPRTFANEDRYTLGNYIDVDGLQMPSVAMLEGPNKENTTSYRINVDYDEQVFTSRPSRPQLNGWEKR